MGTHNGARFFDSARYITTVGESNLPSIKKHEATSYRTQLYPYQDVWYWLMAGVHVVRQPLQQYTTNLVEGWSSYCTRIVTHWGKDTNCRYKKESVRAEDDSDGRPRDSSLEYRTAWWKKRNGRSFDPTAAPKSIKQNSKDVNFLPDGGNQQQLQERECEGGR